MPPLPPVSAREAIIAFERLGWIYDRKRTGHHVMYKPTYFLHLSIPDHALLAPGTLRSLIRKSQSTVEEFIAALKA
ncbi:type II toxin-antitoxin system HicA family toxin [bacterium]|nr:type II toxin-antitoxin system HicA family toxin [bacterium]